PNVVNSLAAVRDLFCRAGARTPPRTSVAEDGRRGTSPRPTVGDGPAAGVLHALQSDFAGYDDLRRTLLCAPKWGNGDERVDELARWVTDRLYAAFEPKCNARGGRWQCALYSFVANYMLGEVVGASADGRGAREMLTRNLNPTWGTDHHGPTAVLRSLSHIDFTGFPDGCSLDLRFDPQFFATPEGRQKLVGFLKTFCDLGVMQMQISMMDTETLLDAREHPERYPELLVKVAGYSARFVDLDAREQEEIIARTGHGV
ncbi:MAG: glycine radical domain-containing protein, partial [Armatimonadota bacterium]